MMTYKEGPKKGVGGMLHLLYSKVCSPYQLHIEVEDSLLHSVIRLCCLIALHRHVCLVSTFCVVVFVSEHIVYTSNLPFVAT